MTALAFLTVVVAGVITYLQVAVPIKGGRLAHADAVYHVPVAVISTLVVLIGAAAIGCLSVRAWRRRG